MKEQVSRVRLGILISGGGTTMEALAKACDTGKLKEFLQPVVVISSKPGVKGIEKAKALNIPVRVVERGEYPKGENGLNAFGLALLNIFQQYNPDAISQNGWLPFTPGNVIDKYSGRIFNQHPAPLDPDNIGNNGYPLHFGGQGMYGTTPHAAVLKFQELSGRRFPTEATIHHVINEFDRGGVVFRSKIPVEDGDTPETLQARVLPFEHQAQILFWEQYAKNDGSVPLLHRSEPLIKPAEEKFLQQAVIFARNAYPNG